MKPPPLPSVKTPALTTFRNHGVPLPNQQGCLDPAGSPQARKRQGPPHKALVSGPPAPPCLEERRQRAKAGLAAGHLPKGLRAPPCRCQLFPGRQQGDCDWSLINKEKQR